MSKRIAIAIDSLAGGGAEKVMLTLAKALLELGHEPHLLVMHDNCSYTIPDGLKVHFCFDEKEHNIDSFWRLKTSTRKLQKWVAQLQKRFGLFDLFLSNLDKTNLLMTRVGVSPLYCVVHNSIEEELKRQLKLGPFAYINMLRAKSALNGQHLITVSKGIEQEILNGTRISPTSIQTIYNPFDFEEIVESSKELIVDIPKVDYFIHVGRFAKQKRHDVLFKALKLTENKLPLVLLCHNQKKALKAVKKYGVEDRIILPGFQKNPFPWIKHAKALVLSSDFEGFGNVLVEAMICGTPAISTNCNYGPNEILTGDLERFLTPIRDEKSMANKLDEILQNPPDIRDAEIFKKVKVLDIASQYLELIK